MLSRLVITFLPRSKSLLISWLQSPSAVILEPRKMLRDEVILAQEISKRETEAEFPTLPSVHILSPQQVSLGQGLCALHGSGYLTTKTTGMELLNGARLCSKGSSCTNWFTYLWNLSGQVLSPLLQVWQPRPRLRNWPVSPSQEVGDISLLRRLTANFCSRYLSRSTGVTQSCLCHPQEAWHKASTHQGCNRLWIPLTSRKFCDKKINHLQPCPSFLFLGWPETLPSFPFSHKGLKEICPKMWWTITKRH